MMHCGKLLTAMAVVMAVAFSALGQTAGTQTSYHSLDAATFAMLVEDSMVVVLDVRSPQKYAEGHLAKAINIPIDGQLEQIVQSSIDISKTLAVYCNRGRSSKLAASRLAAIGYSVIELDGGFLEWQRYVNDK